MEAAILAAGFGTRLRPLTVKTPKALVPVLNRPLLGVWLELLQAAGVRRVALNTHHLAAQVADFVRSQKPPGMEVRVRHEPEILGTGGGLRSLVQALEEDPILAVNADVLTDLDLGEIFRKHRPDALATLVLQDFQPYAKVSVDAAGRITGFGRNPDAGSEKLLAYTGIQVVSRRFLEQLPEQGPADLVDAWRRTLAEGGLLSSLVVEGHFWQEVGTPEAYLTAHRRLLAGEAPKLQRLFPPLKDPLLGEGVFLGEGVRCEGNVCLGKGVRVGPHTHLAEVVAWEGARIGPGLRLKHCLIGKGARVGRNAQHEILV